MSRPLRIQYPGAVYHVTCRGNERRGIFRTGGIELKGKVVGGSVLGREGFIQWVREKFVKDLPAGDYTGYKPLKC